MHKDRESLIMTMDAIFIRLTNLCVIYHHAATESCAYKESARRSSIIYVLDRWTVMTYTLFPTYYILYI